MPIPTIITNVPLKPGGEIGQYIAYTVADAINDKNKEEISYFNILTGYFDPKVWNEVGNSISKINQSEEGHFAFRMVLGREAKKFDAEELQKRFQNDLLDAEIELAPHIQDLIRFLKRTDVGIRLLTFPFMHGKLYLWHDMAIIGSSNFTRMGLKINHELNYVTQTNSDIAELKEWFEYYWQKAKHDYKGDLIEILDKSWLGLYEWTPYEVYTKIAFEYYKNDLITDITGDVFDLAGFQKEGVHRAVNIAEKRGGVLIADAVGLGKTYIGIETAIKIISKIQKHNRRFLVICPAQLKFLWINNLSQANFPPEIHTMENMSSRLPRGKFDVILIDESHNFRKPSTKRYINLQRLLGQNPDAKIILLSATPINTNLMDLYHQLRIITREVDSSSVLMDIGISDLKEYFKDLISEEADFLQIKEAFWSVEVEQK